MIAASTGNHGQSVAYTARLFGVKATIYAPENANAAKVEAMKELGASVILVGADYDEARVACEQLAAAKGYRYIHSGNEPLLIAGVGTHTLEILSEQPQVDVIIVPVGGGSGAAGACIVAKAVNPRIVVIGVQAEKAPSAYLSWRAGKPLDATTSTWAEGLATRTPFELPQRILRRLLDDFILVSDEAISAAVRFLLARNRTLVGRSRRIVAGGRSGAEGSVGRSARCFDLDRRQHLDPSAQGGARPLLAFGSLSPGLGRSAEARLTP